jgi:hypothetical protein
MWPAPNNVVAANPPPLHYKEGSSTSIRAGTPNAGTNTLQAGANSADNLQALIDEMRNFFFEDY